MKRKTWPSSRASIRRHIFAGVVIVAFLAIGVGGWASTAEISGALIAQGSIVVDFERQEGAAPDRRRRRRAAGARRRPGEGRRHSHSPRRDRDPRQSRHCHQGSYRALRAQGAPCRRARRRGDPRDAEGARRIGQRSRRQGSAEQRAQAVRIAAQDPARPEGSAAAAREAIAGADRRTHRPAGREVQGDGAHRAGARRRTRPVGQEPGADQPAHLARARGGAAARRARPAHRRRRRGQGQDHRDRAADPPGRPGTVQRRRQGAARDRQQDRRISSSAR